MLLFILVIKRRTCKKQLRMLIISRKLKQIYFGWVIHCNAYKYPRNGNASSLRIVNMPPIKFNFTALYSRFTSMENIPASTMRIALTSID